MEILNLLPLWGSQYFHAKFNVVSFRGSFLFSMRFSNIGYICCVLHLLIFFFFGSDDFAQKVEKSTTEEVLHHTNDKDTQALLKKVVLIDALDGWKCGILAIGTFGFDPLKQFNQQKEYLVLESKEDDEESPEYSLEGSDSDENDEYSDDTTFEDEEVNPLMLSTLGHSFKDIEKKDVLVSFDGVFLASSEVAAEEKTNISLQSDHEKKKAGRTTLADLFLADADVKMKIDSGKVLHDDSAKKMNAKTKKSLSFAKKFIPKVKEETSPIKNIQRVSNTVFYLSLPFTVSFHAVSLLPFAYGTRNIKNSLVG